jgi:ADA HAT complex component 1
MQVLSWNAYESNTSTPVSNLYNPSAAAKDSSRATASAFSRFNKRKRESEPHGEACGQDWSLNVTAPPKSAVIAHEPNATVLTNPISVPMMSAMDLHPATASSSPSADTSPTLVESDAQSLDQDSPKVVEQCSTQQRRHKIRQTVVQQVNLEILVKHNELRLIDQEIAKCQAALEQLRRCSEIPYPAMQVSQDVSLGVGPALREKYAGARLPSSPAPWGVVDGPYSRHYATWLLPDPRFDGGEAEPSHAMIVTANGKRPAKGRHGRPSIVEDMNLGGMSSRSQRTKPLQALAPGYAQPKEKAHGPLFLKRPSDGAMVKLKCPDCGRVEFGSAQGFINHCRIGHQRTFASHAAAAQQCGEQVKYDASGVMVGVAPVSQPTMTPTTSAHSLVRSAHLLPKTPAAVPKLALSLDGSSNTATKPSNGGDSTSFLAALLEKQNSTIDLNKEVADAKEKIDIPELEVDMSGDEEDSVDSAKTIVSGRPQGKGTRQISAPSKAPSASPVLMSRVPVSQSLEQDDEFGHAIGPSPTADSNQAPSLIDDDEEYEAHTPGSSTPVSEVSEEESLQIRVRDDDEPQQDEMDLEAPSCTRTDQSFKAPARPASSFQKQVNGREQKRKHDGTESVAQEVNADRSKRRKITK